MQKSVRTWGGLVIDLLHCLFCSVWVNASFLGIHRKCVVSMQFTPVSQRCLQPLKNNVWTLCCKVCLSETVYLSLWLNRWVLLAWDPDSMSATELTVVRPMALMWFQHLAGGSWLTIFAIILCCWLKTDSKLLNLFLKLFSKQDRWKLQWFYFFTQGWIKNYFSLIKNTFKH